MKSSVTKALEKHVHRSSKIKGIYFSAQMSSAFRKRVRDAVQSSSEQKESWLNYNKHLDGQEWAMHELHEIKADLRVTFKALPKNGRGVWRPLALAFLQPRRSSPTTGSVLYGRP